jgi:CYTH domain-containing protein
MEIERKFLVPEPPADLDRWPSTRIEQGYVAIDPDRTEVRLRRWDDGCALAFKQGGGRSRTEEELLLDAEQFERLWPLTEGRRIEKRRHVVDGAGETNLELDVYSGALAGLVVVEVEFGSEQAADAFAPPDWFGREVTDDPRFKNQRLAVDGVPGGGSSADGA